MIEYIAAVKNGLDIVNFFSGKKNAVGGGLKFGFENEEECLTHHLKYVASWCSRITSLGGLRAFDIDEIFVPLQLTLGQRLARERLADGIDISQGQLLESGRHRVILGGPGAGKSTLLRYLAFRVLGEPPADAKDTFELPILVECKALEDDETVCEAIGRAFGLTLYTGEGRGSSKRALRDEAAALQRAVCTLLETRTVLLLVDGLDEIGVAKRRKLIGELGNLCMRLENSSILATCRHGALESNVQRAEICAVREFQDQDIIDFCGKWFKGRDIARGQFLQELNDVALWEFARTPLQLSNLCFVFDSRGQLPASRLSIYDTILALRLEQWDRERGIVRTSKYGRAFGPIEKKRFLSALSYVMAVNGIKSRFSSTELRDAYRAIHATFRLPKDEEAIVVNEIESHSGIILQTDFDTFEFIHLTLFEYLCGDFISRMQLTNGTALALLPLPDAAALATGLSAEQDEFFLNLAIRVTRCSESGSRSSREMAEFWNRYLLRLTEEGIDVPNSPSAALGVFFASGMKWFRDKTRPDKVLRDSALDNAVETLATFCTKHKLRNSLNSVLTYFKRPQVRADYVILTPGEQWPPQAVVKPKTLIVDKLIFNLARGV